jgi:dihydroorotate dehydrogenase electron transfer subunit
MDLTGDELHLLVKAVGTGSSILAGSSTGDRKDITGPLGGSTFPPPEGEDPVFIAGGTGLAPMIFAARMWGRQGILDKAVLVYGAECEDELLTSIAESDFTEVHGATIDGSCGYEGDAVTLLENLVASREIGGGFLYSCGPAGMVRAIQKKVCEGFTKHFTSLESVMACGVGACRGCTVPVRGEEDGAVRAVCSDGTVFEAKDIDWEEWTQ